MLTDYLIYLSIYLFIHLLNRGVFHSISWIRPHPTPLILVSWVSYHHVAVAVAVLFFCGAISFFFFTGGGT